MSLAVIHCPHCGAQHIDEGKFALFPHRKHLCYACKKMFDDPTGKATIGVPESWLGHHCHARGCEVEVVPKMFMCRRHWGMLPKEMQDAVWREYQPGQEERKVVVTEAYCKVTDEAIAFIAEREAGEAKKPKQAVMF